MEGDEDPFPLAYEVAFMEFPFMFEAGTSFGFFNTFAVPSISAVLDHSRGFAVCPQVRYDDTALLISAASSRRISHVAQWRPPPNS